MNFPVNLDIYGYWKVAILNGGIFFILVELMSAGIDVFDRTLNYKTNHVRERSMRIASKENRLDFASQVGTCFYMKSAVVFD